MRPAERTTNLSAEYQLAAQVEVQHHPRQRAGEHGDHRLPRGDSHEGHEQRVNPAIDDEAAEIGGEKARPLRIPRYRADDVTKGPKPVAEPRASRGGDIGRQTSDIKPDRMAQ